MRATSKAKGENSTAETAVCPICGGLSVARASRLYDDRYGFPGTFATSDCQRCGHSRADATFDDRELERLYTEWYPRATTRFEELAPFPSGTGFRAWLAGERKSAFRWVPEGVSVLDIGCGFGQTVQYHLARGCSAVGVEADAHAVAEAQRVGLPVRHGVFHAANFQSSSFDVVTMDQVIEHAVDPALLLADVSRVLKPGGRLILSTPNRGGCAARLLGDRWINWHIPYHLNLFTRASLRRLAKDSGFTVDSIKTITASAWARYQWFHLFTRPPMGEPSAFWDPSRTHRTISRRIQRSARLIDRVHGFELATRIGDAIGVGDNLLAILVRQS